MWLHVTHLKTQSVICGHSEVDVCSFQTGVFPPGLADVWHQNWSWKNPCWAINTALCCVVARIFLMAAAGAWTCPGAILLRV